MTQTGYEDKSQSEDEVKLKAPSLVIWSIELEKVGQGLDENVITGTLRIDDEVIGFVRLPNKDYLAYLRKMLDVGSSL